MADPLRALRYTDRAAHRRDAHPGSIWIDDCAPGEQAALWFYCPCGCGAPSRITVGHGHKPKAYVPSWKWNGNPTEPTLDPSIHQSVCGWHGWLRDGYWERV